MLRMTVWKRWVLAVVVAGGALVTGCAGIHWEPTYSGALRKAAEQRKRMLLAFLSPADIDCLEMERKVFSDEGIRKLMDKFIAVRLDPLLHRSLARQLNVETVPAFFVFRPDHVLVGSYQGKMDVEKFQVFLIKHMYN